MSSQPRRNSSTRLAWAGRTSAMCSGSSQADDMTALARMQSGIVSAGSVRTGSVPDREQQQPDEHAGQAEESDLPVGQPGRALEHLAPQARAQEGQQALQHQNQRDRAEDQIRHQRRGGAAGAGVAPGPRIARKKSDRKSTRLNSSHHSISYAV